MKSLGRVAAQCEQLACRQAGLASGQLSTGSSLLRQRKSLMLAGRLAS